MRVFLGSLYLLLDLQSVNDWGKLAKDLVCFLVELELSGDEIGEVAEGFWGIKDLGSISFVNSSVCVCVSLHSS